MHILHVNIILWISNWTQVHPRLSQCTLSPSEISFTLHWNVWTRVSDSVQVGSSAELILNVPPSSVEVGLGTGVVDSCVFNLLSQSWSNGSLGFDIPSGELWSILLQVPSCPSVLVVVLIGFRSGTGFPDDNGVLGGGVENTECWVGTVGGEWWTSVAGTSVEVQSESVWLIVGELMDEFKSDPDGLSSWGTESNEIVLEGLVGVQVAGIRGHQSVSSTVGSHVTVDIHWGEDWTVWKKEWWIDRVDSAGLDSPVDI